MSLTAYPLEYSLAEALVHSHAASQQPLTWWAATKGWGNHHITIHWEANHKQWALHYPAQPHKLISFYGDEYFARLRELKQFLLFILQIATKSGWQVA
jgi:hypothetical protein